MSTITDRSDASTDEFLTRMATFETAFEDAGAAPESLLERVAVAICPGDYCESHGECREDAEAAIEAMRPPR